MKNLANFIMRYRVIVILLLIFLTLLLGHEVTKIGFNADFSAYLQQDDPLVKQFNRVGEVFAGKSIAMVLVESEDIFSAESLMHIGDLTDAYEDAKGVSHVTSLTNVLDFEKTEWGLEVGKLIRKDEIPQSREELKQLRDYTMSKEMYVGNLVSEDGKAAIIVTSLAAGVDETAVIKELRRITEEVAPGNVNISFGGMPALMDSMMLLISKNVNVLLPIMVGLIFLVLIIAFRRPAGIFLPLTIVGIAVIFTMGFMSLFGLSVDMISGIMPVILIAMGSADGIHFMKRYYERRREGDMPQTAVRETFAEMWAPMLITTVTSIVGFISLVISEFSVITQFGLITALGLFLALVITFTLLPAALAFSGARFRFRRKVAANTSNRLLEGIGEVIYRHKVVILASAVVIAVVSLMAIPRIAKDVDWSLCLLKGSKPHRAEMLLREKFGGSVPIQVLVKGDIKEPATLQTMRTIERYLDTAPLVSESLSIASILSEMNYMMNDRYIVPETREGVANLWFLVEGEDMLEQMVTSDKGEALIQGKLATMDTGPLVLAVDEIDQFLEGFPRSLAVFDLREVPSQLRGAFLELRKKDITRNLLWSLQTRGIDIERTKIEKLVGAALFQAEQDAETHVELERRIVEYLLSDESEVEVTSEPEAEAVARSVVERYEKEPNIGPRQIADMVRSELSRAHDEDVEHLSSSLAMIIAETVGEMHVASALQEVEEILPTGSREIRDLYRDLEGDLWEMNENLMAMDMDIYRGIRGEANPPEVREIQLAVSNTGLAPVLKHMEEALTPSQTYSLLIALIFVILLLCLILRSVVGGIISVVPISMTILLNFAVMGYMGIGLDSFTSMIASIAIGLGIDYTVHFNSRFQRELSILKDELQALKRTLGTTGVAIITNALTVGSGFSVLLLAGGQHIRRFGGLTTLTMFSSALFTLTVLPSLILVLKPRYLKKARGG